MAKYSVYTEQEDNIIVNTIKKYPNNLAYAFEEAGQLINRSVRAVNQRYYTVLKKSYDIIGTGSSNGVCINIKNTPRTTESVVVESAIILFNKMTKAEKIQFISKVF